jgi:hypothetical protein
MKALLRLDDVRAADTIMRSYLDRFTFPQKPTESVEQSRSRRTKELMANDEANAMMDRGLDALGRPIGGYPSAIEKIAIFVRETVGGRLARLLRLE